MLQVIMWPACLVVDYKVKAWLASSLLLSHKTDEEDVLWRLGALLRKDSDSVEPSDAWRVPVLMATSMAEVLSFCSPLLSYSSLGLQLKDSAQHLAWLINTLANENRIGKFRIILIQTMENLYQIKKNQELLIIVKSLDATCKK